MLEGGCGWREGHGALTGEAVEGAEDTGFHPAGRGSGCMKTVAEAAGDTEAGEASAAAKAAAGLCGARRAEVKSKGTGRRLRAAGRRE